MFSLLCALVSNVLIVDPASGGSYPDIQSAIGAAAEGDTILVKSGTYAGFSITDKALTLVVDANHNALVNGQIEVDNLSAGKCVSILGFAIQAGGASAVRGQSDAGALRLGQCTISGADGASCAAGSLGASFDQCDDVALYACTLRGGRGGNGAGCFFGGHGGAAVGCVDSQITCCDCTLDGGDGGDGIFGGSSYNESSLGGHAGAGLELLDGFCCASNSLIRGGDGGHGGDGTSTCLGTSPGNGGDGGDGIHAGGAPPPTPNLWLMASTPAGGTGGAPGQPSSGGCWGDFYAGYDGSAVVAPAGALQQLGGSARVLSAPRVTRELQAVPIDFLGEPGDAVWVLFDRHPDFAPDLPFHGVRLTQAPARLVSFGTIGASGILHRQFTLPDYGPLFPARVLHLQALFRDTSSVRYLAGASVLVELDSIY